MLPHHVSDHKIIQVKVVLQRLGQTELTFKKGQQYKKPCWLSTRRWNHLFHTAFTQGMQDDWKEVCACMEDPAQSLSLHDSSEDLDQSLVDYMWKFTTTKLLWTFKTAYYLALLELPDNPDCFEDENECTINKLLKSCGSIIEDEKQVQCEERSWLCPFCTFKVQVGKQSRVASDLIAKHLRSAHQSQRLEMIRKNADKGISNIPWTGLGLRKLLAPCPFVECANLDNLCEMIRRLTDEIKTLEENSKHLATSSTAQGGGGSFKNRKPIGEIGCCESRMAERSH